MIVRKYTAAANRWTAAFLMCAFSVATFAGQPQPLDARVYAKELPAAGIVTFSVNWGRKWGCAGAENAQLQRLAFSRLPADPASAVLDLKTPSKLFVDDRFISYSYVLEPGTYAISAFDVKVAKSKREVGHLLGTSQELMQDGTSKGGTFEVSANEVVYIGHFALDCAEEAIPWRYYVEDRPSFDSLVSEFGQQFPFAASLPVRFRLFSTTMFGEPFSLPDAANPQEK
jgi:hypothetical protein